ncbi:glycosyltransferase [Streptomyces sp. NPDC012794]|uniref:glycosyltransferase n=1 Tax=Streptomyces sp. NPDC012794 TaxID=3364850 RepID=UPI0036844071
MTSDDVLLRRAEDSDARPAPDLWLRLFAAALPTVRCAHDAADVHDWFTRVLVPQYETWVAVTAHTVVGLMVLNGGELKQLSSATSGIPHQHADSEGGQSTGPRKSDQTCPGAARLRVADSPPRRRTGRRSAAEFTGDQQQDVVTLPCLGVYTAAHAMMLPRLMLPRLMAAVPWPQLPITDTLVKLMLSPAYAPALTQLRAALALPTHRPHADTDDILTIGSCPHDWLFPRMRAAVHHAGTGTTHASITASTPTLPIPIPAALDQPYWARRLTTLGLTSTAIPIQHLTTRKLTAALDSVLHQGGYHHRTRAAANSLQQQCGITNLLTQLDRLV